MFAFNFFKNINDSRNIIYVLDRLLQISVDGEGINKKRKIDLSLYRLINTWQVNQEIIHTGVVPICRENQNAPEEFIKFIDNLWAYMEYDINTEFFWAKTLNFPEAQEALHLSMSQKRKELMFYLYTKKSITSDVYHDQLNHPVKHLKNFAS